MRALLQITLCGILATGIGMAQRGGGGGGMRGGGGGGFHGGGGMMGGGGFHGGGGFGGGGFRGGTGFGGFHGGVGINGFRGYGYGYGRGYYGGRYGYYGAYWPYYGYSYPWGGIGYGYSPAYYDYYSYPYPYVYDYSTPYYSAPYYSAPATIAYPQASTVYVERANPVTHDYDQYGQEVRPQSGSYGSSAASGSPIYLIAFKDHGIHAALSYWVNAGSLHFVNLQHEEHQAPVDSVDRALTLQLNAERHVQFNLPR